MSSISFSNIQDGTTIDAADVNGPLNTIYDDYNGGISSVNLATDAVTTTKIQNSAVTTAKIADNNVTNAKLATGAGEPGGAWTTWSPTWTGLTVGNGTLTAKYSQVGKTVFVRLHLLFGSTTAVTALGPRFSLPVTSAALPTSGGIVPAGPARTFNGTSGLAEGLVVLQSTTAGEIRILGTAATYANLVQISSTVPFTWATNYEMACSFTYEAA